MSRPSPQTSRRVLVVAPHPDDETLGCGGLIARTMEAGGAVLTIFVTDGGASHRNSRLWPRAKLAKQREGEAAAALAALGAGEQPRLFLRLADAAMPSDGSLPWREAVTRVAAAIAAFQPDLVLLPWRRDPHCDHRDSWRLAKEALSLSGAPVATLEYAIWLDELGAPDDFPRAGEVEAVSLDIAPWRAAKRRAIAAHVTQTTDLIKDDPEGFRLRGETIERLCRPQETWWLVHEVD